MSAVFFRKKITIILVVVFFFSGLGVFVFARRRMVEIDVGKDFYFLVDTSSHVQASTHEVQLVGGAGYLLQTQGEVAVAFSVYVSERDATRAKDLLKQTGNKADIVKLVSGNLYLPRKDKEKMQALKGAFESLYGNICVLEQEIARLENGATQQSSARLLAVLERNLVYLAKEYGKDYAEYATFCLQTAKAINERRSGIIYAKDLRYLQCVACVSYGDLVKNYNL